MPVSILLREMIPPCYLPRRPTPNPDAPKVMTNPKHAYWRGTGQSQAERRRVVSEVRTLSSIARVDESKPRTLSYTAAEREARANQKFATDQAASAKAELAKLMDPRTGIASMRGAERQAAVE